MKRAIAWFGLAAAVIATAGCAIVQVAARAGAATGVISEQQATAIVKSSEAFAKAKEKLTPENEYYIGRTVAAQILGRYRAYDAGRANEYLNLLGQSLAVFSDKPETYKGYRFLVLDTDEVNAFAAPGGFILVTRGLIRCCKTEDALAAVVAHEIGHVQLEHGLKAISASRWTSFMKTVGVEATKALGSAELGEAVTAFEGSIDDITQEMVNKGYSRSLEYDADKAAVTILTRAGYSAAGLTDMLKEMDRSWKEGGAGFLRTHPSPKDRIGRLKAPAAGSAPGAAERARQSRFEKSVAGV
jgi:predicted Zn-dependent protease